MKSTGVEHFQSIMKLSMPERIEFLRQSAQSELKFFARYDSSQLVRNFAFGRIKSLGFLTKFMRMRRTKNRKADRMAAKRRIMELSNRHNDLATRTPSELYDVVIDPTADLERLYALEQLATTGSIGLRRCCIIPAISQQKRAVLYYIYENKHKNRSK